MPWYWYKQGGWEIAVDAVSKADADQHIKINAPGAKYIGVGEPTPMYSGWSTATAMTTARRQEEISAKANR